MYKWQGGKKKILKEESYQDYSKNYVSSPSDPATVRLVGTNTLGTQLVEMRPAPNKTKNYGYDYIKKLTPLKHSTDGTIVVSAGATAVTGTGTKFTDVNTGAYLRIESEGTHADSKWYKVVTITHDSSLTLETSVPSAFSGVSYTLSEAPDMPAKIHPALIWAGVRNLVVDQNDPNLAFYQMKLAEVLSDVKRLYVTRTYSQDIHTIAEEFRYRY